MIDPDRSELFTPDELAVRLDEWALSLDKSQMDLRSDMRCAAIHLRRLASSDSGVKGGPEPVAWPANLNPRTLDLVQRFALALAKKLRLAEEKYGHTDGWLRDDWEAECRDHLYQHLEKGDPRDVAAYCAFMWHHGWITYRPEITAPPADAGMREALAAVTVDLISTADKDENPFEWASVKQSYATLGIPLTAPGAMTKSDGGKVECRWPACEEAATALTEARVEIESLRESGRKAIDAGEVMIGTLRAELDAANANHRQMATMLADLARKHDALRARVREAVEPFAQGSIDISGAAIIIGYPQAESALRAARQLMEEVK